MGGRDQRGFEVYIGPWAVRALDGGTRLKCIFAAALSSLAFASASCSSQESVLRNEPENEIANLTGMVADRDREISALQNEVAKLRAAAAPSAAPASTLVDNRASKPLPKRAMCYKDYCPCEGPQGGADSLICDQLEEGLEVPIETLIAGRAMREARRQLETGDY